MPPLPPLRRPSPPRPHPAATHLLWGRRSAAPTSWLAIRSPRTYLSDRKSTRPSAFAAAPPSFAATATPSGNPPLVGQAIGSADVLVGDPLTQNISLSVLASGDIAHPAAIGRSEEH